MIMQPASLAYEKRPPRAHPAIQALPCILHPAIQALPCILHPAGQALPLAQPTNHPCPASCRPGPGLCRQPIVPLAHRSQRPILEVLQNVSWGEQQNFKNAVKNNKILIKQHTTNELNEVLLLFSIMALPNWPPLHLAKHDCG
jgi:hypothetical protein